MRLHHYLARAGVASRRRAEALILAGDVRVNGRVVARLGTQVGPGDRVEYRGRLVTPAEEPTYVVLHKPAGVMTTMHDPEHRRTVATLAKEAGIAARVVPVGRLDFETAGLLLLTDDGDLAFALAHPRFGVEKTYRATVRGRVGRDDLARLAAGIALDGVRTRPALLRVIAARRDDSVVDVTVHEGRTRQVRRMFASVGHPVVDLVRTRFGPLRLGTLPPGHVRAPSERELAELLAIKRAAGETR